MKNTTTTIDQHQPTLWPMAHAFVGKSHPDSIPVNPTKVIGKEKRTDSKKWKVPKVTAKTTRVRRKADKWIAKHSHRITK